MNQSISNISTLKTVGIRDEHWTRLGLDWIRTIANFVEYGLNPDCKSL